MSIVMVGGNKCMERRYLDTCRQYGCRAKVFNQMHGELRRKIGSPDLVIVFTNSVSHKMLITASVEARRCSVKLTHCHDSLNALEHVLKEYCG